MLSIQKIFVTLPQKPKFVYQKPKLTVSSGNKPLLTTYTNFLSKN